MAENKKNNIISDLFEDLFKDTKMLTFRELQQKYQGEENAHVYFYSDGIPYVYISKPSNKVFKIKQEDKKEILTSEEELLNGDDVVSRTRILPDIDFSNSEYIDITDIERIPDMIPEDNSLNLCMYKELSMVNDNGEYVI